MDRIDDWRRGKLVENLGLLSVAPRRDWVTFFSGSNWNSPTSSSTAFNSLGWNARRSQRSKSNSCRRARITFIVLALVAAVNSSNFTYSRIHIFSDRNRFRRSDSRRPSRAALIPRVFPEREIMAAASTDTASQNLAAIIGPLLFAFVAVNWGLTAVFFTCAISVFLDLSVHSY